MSMLSATCTSYTTVVFFFFFKQKTAYEMLISDWSSDVCSSDLRIAAEVMQRLTHPVDVDGQRFLLATSAGGALYPDDARDPDEYVNVCMEALRLAHSEGAGHQIGRAHV